ncbi:MAG: GNAT family N-acetyltransferase [Clostridiales bacterium]|jgi:predicted acetyltransferase|nr:GNAT family N-acetyltransferase [Clostridiales bacterium]
MKRIVLPSASYRAAFYKMADEYKGIEDRRYYKEIARDGFDFEEYVGRLHLYSKGLCLEKGLVPYTTYWLVDSGDAIFGVSRLRHVLNANSRKEGGHIGYDVPPSSRNAGNATELLRQTLAKAKGMGIMRALVTCDASNAASARVITKNGGKLENQVISDFTGNVVNRYWVNC